MSIERNVVSTQAKKLENCAHIGGKTNGELSTVACTSTNFKTTQPRRVSTTYNRAENNRSNIYSFLGPPSPHKIEFWLCLLSSRPNRLKLRRCKIQSCCAIKQTTFRLLIKVIHSGSTPVKCRFNMIKTVPQADFRSQNTFLSTLISFPCQHFTVLLLKIAFWYHLL